ncbi:hypothetical protein EBZ39_10075 [bacterium]|nr:hypothetical protein [bacterium]
MTMRLFITVSLVCAISQLSAQEQEKENPEQGSAVALTKPANTAHDYYAYLKASYQHLRGNAQEALKIYQDLLSYDPSPHAHAGYLQLMSDIGQHKPLLEHYERHADKLKEALKSNTPVQLAIAQAYLTQGDTAKAEEVFVNLADTNPDNEHVAYYATLAYLKTGQLDKAHEFIKKCLAKPSLKPKHFLFLFLQGKVQFQQQDLEGARASLQKCLELSPKFAQAQLFQAIVQEQLGRANDALKGYERFLALGQRDLAIEKHVISLLFNQGNYPRAIKYLERINAQTPDYFYDLALLHFQNKQPQKALKLVDKSLSLDGAFLNAILLKIKILTEQRATSHLQAFAQQLLEAYPSNIQVLHVYQLLKNMGLPLDTVINLGLNALQKKQSALLMACVADLCVEGKKLALAEKIYRQLIKRSKNPTVRARARYQICYAYFQCGQDKELEKQLLEAIQESQVDPGVYNLLAYHYASQTTQLDQALSYAERALASNPSSAPFLDTKAYVLLKLGKRDDAYKLLEEAHRQAPNDKVIQQRFIALQSII